MTLANTLFAVEMLDVEAHALVTEDGEVLPFATSIDATLGGVQTGMLGEGTLPGSWFREFSRRSRTANSKALTAYLVDRSNPRRDGDRMTRLLPDVRELWLPDGNVIPLDGAELAENGRPRDDKLELIIYPTGPTPQHPLLDAGVLDLALPTESSTPERPIFGFDPAGSIRAPLLMTRAGRGALAVSAVITESSVWGLASVGTPVHPDGTGDPEAVSLSFQGDRVTALVGGTRKSIVVGSPVAAGTMLVVLGIPAAAPLPISAVLAWRGLHARLTVKSLAGVDVQHFSLPAPLPDLSERVLTAGVRSDGRALAGYLSPGLHFFAPRYPSEQEAERFVAQGYADVTEPDLSWAVMPPDFALNLVRADAKPLELAPGESLTFDLTAQRIDGYTGPLTIGTEDASDPLTISTVPLSQTADADTYRVTVTAPAGAGEAAYTVLVEVKATGADVPGSLLSNVRDTFSDIVQVAASPVIAPNPTVVMPMQDPVQYRMSEFLRDTSGNNNTFSWHGFARPNRAGKGVLSPGAPNFPGITGPLEAAIYSGVLQNPAQPQRMAGNATYCLVNTGVSKTPVGGVMWGFAAEGNEDGAAVLRAQGGFALRTRLGSTVVTSPDVLPYSSDYAQLIFRVGATDVTLTDRLTMRSITLARPAWVDAGVRTFGGATRSATGTFSEYGRVHYMTLSIHPYAMSDIQARRNMDFIVANYAPASDGKPEYGDSLVALFQFNDNTTEQPAEKLKNRAAPALGVAMTATGAVTYPPGAVATPGNTTAYLNTGAVFSSSGTLTVVTTVQDFANASDYDCNFGVTSTGVAAAAIEVSRYFNGKPLLRHQNGGDAGANATWAARSLDKTSPAALMTLALEVSSSGGASKLTSLDTGQVTTLTGTAMSGLLRVSLGAIIRSSGSVQEGQRVTNREVAIYRGVASAATLQDTYSLMRT